MIHGMIQVHRRVLQHFILLVLRFQNEFIIFILILILIFFFLGVLVLDFITVCVVISFVHF